MTRFGVEYQVGRSSGVCSATGRPLQPGTPCIAALCEREADEGFDRLDFSTDAWERGERPPRLYSFWRTVVPQPDAKPRMLVDDSVLMDLFERLGSDDRPQRVAFRFVLCLILMRKKQLKFLSKKDADGVERWLVQPRAAAGVEPQPAPLEVLNPQLSDESVRELLEQLNEILQSEL